MKRGGKEKRSEKQRSLKSNGPAVHAGPTLREFWAELRRAEAAGEPLPVLPRAAGGGAVQGAPAARASGSFRSSGSGSGSGSGGAGYGLSLIAPDPESQERIRRIMRSLCEKDAKRGL